MDTGRHRTAMHRQSLSLPAQRALIDGLIGSGDVLDYGCGRGGDVLRLRRAGVDARGWDPHYAPDPPPAAADVVLCSYVLNVIADPKERADTLRRAWELARAALVVAVRTDREAGRVPGTPAADGIVTSRGTFQVLLPAAGLAAWAHDVLGLRPTPAGTGLLYLFRTDAGRAAYLANRFATAAPAPALVAAGAGDTRPGAAAAVLERLAAWAASRGRAPAAAEEPALFRAAAAHFGSVGRAFTAAAQLADPSDVDAARRRSRDDLLVFLALDAFHGRTGPADLPAAAAADARAFFGGYRRAVAESDRLLLFLSRRDMMSRAARASRVGKLTPTALYVHGSAVSLLNAPLRAYAACAELVAGRPAAANLVKLHHDRAAVSFLTYPDFDVNAHPRLAESLHIDLAARTSTWNDYTRRDSRPLLHRKEEFVGPDHPRRAMWSRLTAREAAAGLYADPSTIGTCDGWQRALDRAGVDVRGHRLFRLHPA